MTSPFARTARTHRVPILLLALLAGTLLLPGVCDEARVTVGSWLPRTAGPDPRATTETGAEELATRLAHIARIEEDLAARAAGDGVLAGIPVVARRAPPGLVRLATRVIHRETSAARRSVLVDVGRDDGVIPGQPVVQMDSLIGIVVTAAPHAARVLRIDDRSAATSLPAVVLAADSDGTSPCRGTGVARGTGDGRLRISYLPSGGARVGDLVVTGAGSRLVPEGLLLGEVIDCGDDDRDGNFDAVVRPLRDLDAVASVFVLRSEAPGLRVDSK